MNLASILAEAVERSPEKAAFKLDDVGAELCGAGRGQRAGGGDAEGGGRRAWGPRRDHAAERAVLPGGVLRGAAAGRRSSCR